MKQVRMNMTTYKQLCELSDRRKGEDALVRTKQDIAAQAIAEMHNREVKRLAIEQGHNNGR